MADWLFADWNSSDFDTVTNGAFSPAFSSAFDIGSVSSAVELASTPIGTATVAATLSIIRNLAASVSGNSFAHSNIIGGGVGFEIPYLLGQGGHHEVELTTTIGGASTVTASFSRVVSLQATTGGISEVGRYAFYSTAEKSQIIPTFSGFVNPGQEIAKALDGSTATSWLHGSAWVTIGDYVIFQFPTPQTFVRISQDCTGVGGEYPRGWTLHGSNNGTTWTDLAYDTASSDGVIDTDIPPGFRGPWLYYRILITAISGSLDKWRVKEFQFYRDLSGSVDHTVPLTVLSPGTISALARGTTNITAELYVNAIRLLAATINGTSTVQASPFVTLHAFDPRSIIHMYLSTNVGVGFDPTDTYPGAVAQTYPDGQVRDDFWEYLYIFTNVGAGFDPTDDASTRPDFVSQTYPDGHTRDDFWEYLHLYLNVVRGFQQQGQLVIRPGYTSGPILPGARPPKNMP